MNPLSNKPPMINKREIKFRAWDLNKKVMVYDGDTKWEPKAYPVLVTNKGISYCIKKDYKSEDDFEFDVNAWNDIELMENTGLHDKNGKEVFEGDIVKTYDGDLFEIFWNENHAGLSFKRLTGIRNGEMTWHILLFGGEVVGNIYENPNLLNSKQGEDK